LLKQIPSKDYPLVVKPGHGNSSQGIYLIESSEKLADLQMAETDDGFFLAQRYMENPGFDLKIYVIGREICATIAKKSPFHGMIEDESIAPTREICKLALDIGNIFGLEIYGIDVVETSEGLVLLDINDFPSFSGVPSAAIRVSEYILDTVKKAKRQRAVRIERNTNTHYQPAIGRRI
jgi:ribosomal protein S6--L-glutamate ligase